jgi:hypothetical protein
VNKRLIDPAPRYINDQPRLHYRITTVGAYTTRVLLSLFAYVDAVLVDTPIVDEQYRALIEDVHSIEERLSRSEYFRLYLDKQWSLLNDENLPWQWPAVSDKLSEDIRQIGKRVVPGVWGAYDRKLVDSP